MVEIEAMPALLVETFSRLSDISERMAAVLKVVTVLPD